MVVDMVALMQKLYCSWFLFCCTDFWYTFWIPRVNNLTFNQQLSTQLSAVLCAHITVCFCQLVQFHIHNSDCVLELLFFRQWLLYVAFYHLSV